MAFKIDKFMERRVPGCFKRGSVYVLPCMCGEEPKPEKMYVYSDGTAYCHRCSRHYSLFQMVQLVTGCSAIDTIREIQEASDLTSFKEMRNRLMEPETPVCKELEGISETALPVGFKFYGEEEHIPSYFARRGISAATAEFYKMGYGTEGKYFNRLIIPIFHKDRLYGFQARSMWNIDPAVEKKYLFSPGFPSGHLLYNFDVASQHESVVITEGVFDAVAVGYHAMASFGTHITDHQVALLKSAPNIKTIVMLWDQDATAKSVIYGKKLRDAGFDVHIARLEDSRDPDELTPVELAQLTVTPLGGWGATRARLAAL